MDNRAYKKRKVVTVTRPCIVMANTFSESGGMWLIHLLCWLLEAKQGGVELGKDLQWTPDVKKDYEVHKGHYRGNDAPLYVDFLVCSTRNPLDVIINKYFYNDGIGDIQSCVDVVCKEWRQWAKSWLDYEDDIPVYFITYEKLKSEPRQQLNTIYQEVTGRLPNYDIVTRAIEENTMAKLRSRTNDEDGKFFGKGVIGGYVNLLSDKQIAQVYENLGEYMRQFGYKLL